MNFSDKLNYYINELNCSNAILSKESGLSESTISRYKNGERTPNNPSKQLDKLIKGLANLYKNNNNESTTEKTIRESFNKIIKSYDIDKMINNFNKLVSVLNINVSDFSKMLGFDPSYLSKIRSGERKPSNPSILLEAICIYIIKDYSDEESKKQVAKLINCQVNDLSNSNKYKELLNTWLSSNYKETKNNNDINNFLTKLNDFNLNEYIKAIKFDELKVPTLPFKLPKSKNYYGIEEMKQGELDFLKSTVLSKDSKTVFMCSDMQIDDLAKDLNFGKKWMFGIAMMLKKGIHLNFIHNVDRPFNEMMLGLESWIPIYMTGQVSPFYIPNLDDNTYSHLNYVSDSVILTGECIKGYHNKGKYYLTNNKAEITYYKEKAKLLLKKSKPLMKIYCKNEKIALNNFINTRSLNNEKIKIINSSLPIYTIENDLLLKILIRNNINQEDIDKILTYVKKRKSEINKILKNNNINEVITKITKEEFEAFPTLLDLDRLFYEKNIIYTYDEYLEHFNSTKHYSKSKNYILVINNNMTFRNIKITINTNKWVMISKNNNPTIHFIIEHQKLCKAIENFDVPVSE